MGNWDLIYEIVFLCFAGFIAAFIDAIAGSGGLISVPAFLAVGLTPHYAIGTNKFSASFGSLTSTLRYAKSKKIDSDILKVLLPFSFIGSILGAYVVLLVDSSVLKPIILTLIMAVGIYSFLSKNIGLDDHYNGPTKKTLIIGAIFALSMGFYDGFFGPGVGSLIIIGLIKIYGFDFVRASGNAKAMNFTSNITALVMFIIGGKIDYLMGIPVAIFMMLGARAGAKLAIKNGSKLIRPIFIIMSLAAAVKISYDMFL